MKYPAARGLDRQRHVGRDRVQVLLDDGEHVPVQGGQRVQQRRHVGLAVRRLDHDAQRHGLGQRQPFGLHPLADLRVDQLDVQVGDPLREVLDDLQVVAAAVGDVPGVQAEVHVLRVGFDQELLDPVLDVEVGVGVRVRHQVDAVLLEDDLAQFVGSGDQVLPLLGVDVAGLGRLAGVHVRVLLGQVDEELGAHLAEQLRLLAELGDRLVQRLLALVQAGENRSTADLQAALVQFVAELLRVLRQEALRAQLGPHVAGVLHVVEVLLPADLVIVAGEPHPPGVGRRAEGQPGIVRGGRRHGFS